MRLSTLPSSLIAPELLSELLKLGIMTDIDLILSDIRDILKRLTPRLVTFQELSKVYESVAACTSAEGESADSLYFRDLATCHSGYLSSGIADLDVLLLGGIGGVRVLEISGDKGAGKTALAMHFVLRLLSVDATASALWIDTVGDFSGARLTTMLPAYDGFETRSALDRFHVSLAFDVETALRILESLSATFAQATDMEGTHQIRMVVIDAITPLLGPSLSATSSQGHAAMVGFMRQLRTLSRIHHVTVLVLNAATNIRGPGGDSRSITNSSSAFVWTTRKPSLGPSFSFLSDGTLWLSHWRGREYADMMDVIQERESSEEIAPKEGQLYIAEVFTSRFTRSKTWCAFRIRPIDGVPISTVYERH